MTELLPIKHIKRANTGKGRKEKKNQRKASVDMSVKGGY